MCLLQWPPIDPLMARTTCCCPIVVSSAHCCHRIASFPLYSAVTDTSQWEAFWGSAYNAGGDGKKHSQSLYSMHFLKKSRRTLTRATSPELPQLCRGQYGHEGYRMLLALENSQGESHSLHKETNNHLCGFTHHPYMPPRG